MKIRYLLLFLGLVFLGTVYAEIDLPVVKPKPQSAVVQRDTVRLSDVNLPPISPRQTQPEQPRVLPTLNLPPVGSGANLPPIGEVSPQLASIGLPNTEPDISEPRFEDFTGGWNTEDFPDAAEDRDAIKLQNFLWSMRGQLEPRAGYAYRCSTECNAGEHIWGLYPYYLDEKKIILTGFNGVLIADTSGNCDCDSVLTGLQENDKFYNFETFLGKALVAHEDDYPFAYEYGGTPEVSYFGESDTGWGHYSCNTLLGEVGACTAYVVTKTQTWEVGEHAGKTVRVAFTATGDTYWFFIVGNTTKTLFLDGNCHACDGCPLCSVIPSPYTVTYHVYSWYNNLIDTDTLRAEVKYVADKYPCSDSIILSACPPDSFVGAPYTMQAISGGSNGEEHFLKYIDCIAADSCVVFPTHEYGSADYSGLEAGDSVRFVRKGMWTVRDIEIYRNRVWLLDADEDVIYFSEPNTIADFLPNSFVSVNSGDGDKVTALAGFYDDQLGYKDNSKDVLVILKGNATYKLVFNSADDYSLVQVAPNVGCVAPQSVVGIEGKYILFLHDTGVYAFNGRTVDLVSAKIHAVIEQIERNPHHDRSAAGYCKRHYFLSYPDTFLVDPGADGELDESYSVIVFEDDRDGYWGCYAQRYDINIDPIDTNFRVDDDETGTDQEDPQVTIDGQERWIFAWSDQRYGDPYYDVRFRRFANDGTALDTSIQVNEDFEANQWMSDIDANREGRFVVVWEDERTPGSTDIYAQRFDSAGNSIGDNFLADTCTARCRDPQVEIADDGKFVICWYVDNHVGEVYHEVFFQRYDSAGNAVGNNEGVLDTPPYDLGSFLGMSMNPTNGTFVVSWSRNEQQYGTYDVWAQRVDSAGTPLGTNFKVNDDGTNYTQEQPGVAMNNSGEFIISMDDWRDYASDGFGHIYLQRYDSSASPLGTNIKVNPDTSDTVAELKYNSCDIDTSGAFVVAWCSYYDVGDSIDILARALSSGGSATTDAFRVNDSVSTTRQTERNEVCLNPYCALSSYVETSEENNKAIALNVDHGGWSQMVNFAAGLYATQHGLADTVNLIFSDPADRAFVFEYGKVFADTGQNISLLYKSKAFDFGSIAHQKRVSRFFINYWLESGGSFDVSFYTDFGDSLRYTASVSTAGGNRYIRTPLDITCRGRNISYKIESTDRLKIDNIRLSLKQEED